LNSHSRYCNFLSATGSGSHPDSYPMGTEGS